MRWLAATCLVVTFVMGTFGWFIYRRIQEIASWPSVAGVIVESGLKHTLVDSTSRKRHLALVPAFRYEFKADGRKFIGERLSNQNFSQYVPSLEVQPNVELSALLRRYPVGTPVIVHYNPRRPESSLLEIDRSGPLICWVIASAAAIVTVLSLVRAAR